MQKLLIKVQDIIVLNQTIFFMQQTKTWFPFQSQWI